MKAVIRFIKDLYSGPFQATLVFSFTLVAAMTIGAGAWVISSTINSYLYEVMDERVARDILLAQTFYDAKLQEIRGLASRLSLNTVVLDNLHAVPHQVAEQVVEREVAYSTQEPALKGTYFIAVMDAEGDVLFGYLFSGDGELHPTGMDGNWYNLPIVRHALEQKTLIASTEIIPQEFLQQIGLAEQARIELLDTPRAAPEPYDPREGTAGLVLAAVAPMLDADHDVYGGVLVFHLLNNDFTLVDQIRDTVQTDAVTIFMGDLRVSTNVMTAEGNRAVGTRLSQEVGDVVLRDGREYVGTAFVVNQNYITRYEPLRDHNGQIVGILYVGVQQASFFRLLNTFNQRIMVVAVLSILMTFILATPVSRSITRPLKELRELVETSRRVTAGDLGARAPIVAGGEVGLVAESFNTMLDTLQSIQDQLIHSEKLASLGQLAAGIAHELNNPLGIVLLYAETMLAECSEDDPRRADLNMIVGETKRCKRIVSDLLNFARQNKVIAQPTDIHAVIQGLVDLASKRSDTGNIVFKTEFDPDLPVIEGDPPQLRQVFLNLMTNAVEAMPNGGTLTIRTFSRPAGMITIEFQDTGMGISPENLSKLFTPFFTTKPVGKGTGLGLAIIYGIIKMHRGQISVQSKTGEGTTFTITLPIRQPPTENQNSLSKPVSKDETLIG